MSVMEVDALFAMLLATAGAMAGWWLRAGEIRRKSQQHRDQTRYAREALARLRQLAHHVAADVGEHTNRVEEINEELTGCDAHETEAVLSAVDKLLAANDRMHQQLASADEKLREQARQIETHAAEARTDALTRLANRRAFDDEMTHRLAESRRYGKTFSVMILDVDHFKSFNDSYGHQVGDAVLRGLARVLRNAARESDLVARYGGEEFAMILPGTSAAHAKTTAERLRETIAGAHFHFADTALKVTASVGTAELLSGESVSRLIARADAALYAAKEGGRNRACWHDGHEVYPVAEDPQPDPPPQQPGETAPPQPPEPIASKPEPTPPAKDPAPPPAEPPTAPAEPEAAASAEVSASGPGGPCDRQAFDKMLNRRLAEWRRGGTRPSVVLVRIDEYPKILSELGKQAGAVALRTTIRFLNAALREMDMLAYYDTATFAALLPEAQLTNTIRVAERLREAIASCVLPVGGKKLKFTVSVSAAVATGSDDTLGLLRRAKEALRAALQSGGNCSYFHNGQWSEIADAAPQEIG